MRDAAMAPDDSDLVAEPHPPLTMSLMSFFPPTADRPVLVVPAGEPPVDYVPLEMPELWEPPVETVLGDAYMPVEESEPMLVPAPVVVPETAAVASVASRLPRSFNGLRQGVLAGRMFRTLEEFAVAAVAEAGHPPFVVARLFRVPVWKLEKWVDDASRRPARRTRGTV